jgi:hypothetical protein
LPFFSAQLKFKLTRRNDKFTQLKFKLTQRNDKLTQRNDKFTQLEFKLTRRNDKFTQLIVTLRGFIQLLFCNILIMNSLQF